MRNMRTERKTKPALHIEDRPIASIQPYDKNPRINDPAIDAVAASIKEFGFRQPIVVDDEGIIIVGHTRHKAALKLGLKTVPVHVAKGLTPAQAKAYRIADNQTARLSGWDDTLLPLELLDLKEMGFDLGLTGFSDDELLQLLEQPPSEGLTDADFIPEAPDEAETSGYSVTTDCYVATAAGPRTWTGCSTGPRFI
jgi:ParB-like chromosome segregation protein Spo0J